MTIWVGEIERSAFAFASDAVKPKRDAELVQTLLHLRHVSFFNRERNMRVRLPNVLTRDVFLHIQRQSETGQVKVSRPLLTEQQVSPENLLVEGDGGG